MKNIESIIAAIFVVVTCLLIITAIIRKDRTIVKEILSLWLGVACLAVLAYFYVSLAHILPG